MRVVSFVFCIFLSISVIFLLSMGVQATEFSRNDTEVNAEEILDHMEKGDDIYLDNCRIVDELNASRIKLDSVRNPYFYKELENGVDEEYLFDMGVNKNLSVIGSKIIIENSIFENRLDLSNIQFKNYVNFYNTGFTSDADFSDANFGSDADFYNANFESYADFSDANFGSYANLFCPETSENIIADGKTCEFFMKSYNNGSSGPYRTCKTP